MPRDQAPRVRGCLAVLRLLATAPRITVSEARIAEPSADRQHAPALHVLHEGRLAQALHHGVIVHDHHGLVIVYFGDGLAQTLRQIKAAALPVAGEVLPAAVDRPLLVNETRAADADEGREAQALLLGLDDKLLEHVREPLVPLGIMMEWRGRA